MSRSYKGCYQVNLICNRLACVIETSLQSSFACDTFFFLLVFVPMDNVLRFHTYELQVFCPLNMFMEKEKFQF